MHVLTLTSLFPNACQPLFALFVRTRMEAFTRKFGHKWSVVAPVPWFPRLPVKVGERYHALARVPAFEDGRGYPVHHPRYLVVPKLFMGRYWHWMAQGAAETVLKIHREHPIDVIDAHYVYPDGLAAAALGSELGVPVVISARGTDLNVFPNIPGIRPKIEESLDRCRKLICVSRSLKQKALELGIREDKVAVIGNGVDAALFRRGETAAARAALGLPAAAPIFFSVGNLIELKGFHLAIEALAGLARRDALLLIAGQGPLRPALEAQAAKLGLQGRVRFAGGIPNAELPKWYQAADVFVLASSREGWPNVVTEAQACGLPVVATRVAGIPDIVTDDSLGILIGERSSEALRAAMAKALATAWDRDNIARAGRARTWDAVSDELQRLFAAAVRRD